MVMDIFPTPKRERKMTNRCWFCKREDIPLKVIRDKKIEHDLLECDDCTLKLERAFKDAKASDWKSARATANSWLQKSRGGKSKARKEEPSEDSQAEVSDTYAPW